MFHPWKYIRKYQLIIDGSKCLSCHQYYRQRKYSMVCICITPCNQSPLFYSTPVYRHIPFYIAEKQIYYFRNSFRFTRRLVLCWQRLQAWFATFFCYGQLSTMLPSLLTHHMHSCYTWSDCRIEPTGNQMKTFSLHYLSVLLCNRFNLKCEEATYKGPTFTPLSLGLKLRCFAFRFPFLQ